MNNNRRYALIAIHMFMGIVIAGCAPAATETPAPAATEAPPTTALSATATQTACAPPQANWDPTTADKGSKGITLALEQEPDVAVGLFSSMSSTAWIWQMFGVGPGKWDDKNNLVAYAATEVPSADNDDISTDGTTVTWKLKPCLFWSDGQPITSRDIAFTWKAIMDPANAPVSRSGFDQITGIDTPDDHTAVIQFKEVYPAWPTLFVLGPTNFGGGLLPEHIFQGKTALEKDPQVHRPSWAGGPFAIKEWVAGDHITLIRNPNYFGTPAKLDYVDIRFVPDSKTGLAALKNGDVDLMVNLVESDMEAIKALEPQGIHLRVDATPVLEYLFFNLGTTKGATVDGRTVGVSDKDGFCPFQDVNVRKAIMLGIDRLSFIKNYLKEDEKAFIATLWPNSYWTNTSLTPYPYDPTQAASLLDAAGYKVGSDGIRAGICNGMPAKFSLGIETTTARRRVDVMAAIQADLKKIGIDIKPKKVPAGTFFGSYAEGADMPTGKFDMAIFTTGFYPDPDPGSALTCDGVPSKANPNGGNYSHLCDPQMDTLIADGLVTADPVTRQTIYGHLQQYMYDNVTMIPLYAHANVYAYSDRLIFPASSGYSSAFWDSELFDVKQ